MSKEIWKEWAPGVLSNHQVKELVKAGYLGGITPNQKDTFGASAINLDLKKGYYYEMGKGAVKPYGERYSTYLKGSSDVKKHIFKGPVTLKRCQSYVFELKLHFKPLFCSANVFHGQATGRSSVGRVDVLTRLIVDGMEEYEGFSADALTKEGSSGCLYLEVTPITFDVAVKPDTALSQLRIFLYSPEVSRVDEPDLYQHTLIGDGEPNPRGVLRLSLDPDPTHEFSAFVGKRGGGTDQDLPPVPLWDQPTESKPDPETYWDGLTVPTDSSAGRRLLRIEQGRFYILRSYEKLCLPPGVAVYCKPSHEAIGELRIHYAGFVHPYFGLGRQDGEGGTPLIFEVRGHDLPTVLAHKEKLAYLEYYRMSLPPKREDSKYETQILKLSAFFAPWPCN